jgi:hypothetical protein
VAFYHFYEKILDVGKAMKAMKAMKVMKAAFKTKLEL